MYDDNNQFSIPGNQRSTKFKTQISFEMCKR